MNESVYSASEDKDPNITVTIGVISRCDRVPHSKP